jgi:hypothetical protein
MMWLGVTKAEGGLKALLVFSPLFINNRPKQHNVFVILKEK